jgi:hypothetical protein
MTKPRKSFEEIACEDALRGDFRYLFGLLGEVFEEAGLSAETLATVTGLIEGKIKRPKHRPKLPKRHKEAARPALRVRELEQQGWGKRAAAVARVAEEMGIRKAAVQASLA